jgi:hypothetical protein
MNDEKKKKKKQEDECISFEISSQRERCDIK